MSIESVMPSNHLILCCPLLFPPSIFPRIRVFSSESVLPIKWPKYWSFSLRISPSNEYSALISFRMDWLDLLAVQGTLKSLIQHHSSKASILRNRRQIEGAWRVGAEEMCHRSLAEKRKSNGSRGKQTLPCLFQRDALLPARSPQPAPRTQSCHCHSVLSRRAGPPFLCSPQAPNTHRELSKHSMLWMMLTTTMTTTMETVMKIQILEGRKISCLED